MDYNTEHGIEPVSIVKGVYDLTERLRAGAVAESSSSYQAGEHKAGIPPRELARMINELENQMKAAAQELEFERAAMLRDQIYGLRSMLAEESNLPAWKKAKILAGEEEINQR